VPIGQVTGEGVPARLKDRAYEILRDRIVRLELPPLAPLSERVLSADLEIGLQPIRAAIRRLEFEHLATVFPQRGTFVSEVGVRDERYLAEVRVDIEGLCAELAAVRSTAHERERLVSLAEANQVWPGPEPTDGDTAFHRALYEMSHNPFLEKTLNQYYNLSSRLWHYCTQQLRMVDEPVENSHLATAVAIREGHPSAARQAAQEHIVRSSEKLARMIAAQPLPSR